MQMLTSVDAICTNVAGCAVCVSTADCVPILLYDMRHQAVAAIHSGWRGTVKRILTHSLRRMNELYGTEGKDLLAAIGPSISLESFEVGDEVYEAFDEARFDMRQIATFDDEARKYHIDLWKANTMQLDTFGVPNNQIQVSGICTYRSHEDFFSARRLGKDSGRILSGIMINK